MRRREDKFPDNGFEAWGGYMQAKILKLEEQFCIASNKEDNLSDIFKGVSIYVNGFTIPSADELKALMSKHGGVYHTYQRTDDYIIASNLPDTKVKNMSLMRVVRPEWITDSIAKNCLLDFREYLLYKNSRTQQQINLKKTVKVEGNLNNNNLSDISKEISIPHTIGKHEQTLCCNLAGHDISDNNFCALNTPLQSAIHHSHQIIKTAADPNFISDFYNNSRLHHISQLGACFKQYINDLREKNSNLFPSRIQLKNKILASNNHNQQLKFEKNKIIMHIDMDCFFVSVGLRNRAELIGKPVAVTHSKGGQSRSKRQGVDRNIEFSLFKQKQAKKFGNDTVLPEENIIIENGLGNIGDEGDEFGSMSEIASCSYEARSKGVRNGMFLGAALKLCPDLQTISYNFEGYKEVAYTLYNTIVQYTLDIEAVSCDEMYVDCTELLTDMNVSVQEFATVLRDEIKSKTGCLCSAGFGGNRLQARLATKQAKPDGQFFLTEDIMQDFMFDIKLKDLPGVGRQISHKLESLGHETCGSLQSLTLAALKNHLGNKTGAQLFDQCRGRDSNPLTFYTVRKSVSAEVNYGIRFDNNDQCNYFLKQLSAEVHSRMQQFKVLGQCITLKLMVRAEEAPVETAKFMGHGFCNVINKSTTLNYATNDVNIIINEVLSLRKKLNIDPKEMRGVGIQITKLKSINNTITEGAINKFLLHNKLNKTENKTDMNIPDVIKDTISNPVQFKISVDSDTIHMKPVTPKKAETNLSPKKSPIISVKSPTGKKRGRPLKKLQLQQSSTSKNLIHNFFHGQNYKNTPFKDPMVKEMVHKDIKPKEEKNESKINEGLLGLPWEKVRELLRAWLESGQTPLQCDINMLVVYLQEMVINKNIEKLHVLMNFLNRMTKEMGSHEWTEVYKDILEQVQNAMLAVYGKKMFINK